jgi:2,3-bisphosphoglycerate-independent phosphoglycerate mutase
LIDAIGCGMKIMPGDVSFRGNWGLHWIEKE